MLGILRSGDIRSWAKSVSNPFNVGQASKLARLTHDIPVVREFRRISRKAKVQPMPEIAPRPSPQVTCFVDETNLFKPDAIEAKIGSAAQRRVALSDAFDRFFASRIVRRKK